MIVKVVVDSQTLIDPTIFPIPLEDRTCGFVARGRIFLLLLESKLLFALLRRSFAFIKNVSLFFFCTASIFLFASFEQERALLVDSAATEFVDSTDTKFVGIDASARSFAI